VALDTLLAGASEDQIAIVQARLEAAQIALDLANYYLSRGILIAPFDGVVAKVNLVPGEFPPMDQPAILLFDTSAFYLDIPVDEADISKVAVDQLVNLTFDALPGEVLTGRVSRIADTAINLGGVVTYAVRIDLDSTTQPLRSGLSATAVITVDQINNVIRVRNRFVRLDRRTGKASVIVQLPNGKLGEVEVTLGLRNETYSEVKSGLIEGDVVILLPRELNLF
jgi:HlyD family secretion protein